MKEKERYIIDRFDDDIFDTKKEYYPSNQTICEIINQQDKRIKELEEELRIIQYYKTETNKLDYELRKENQRLKQQLTEKEKEIEGLKAQRRIYLNRSVEECNKITDLEFELQHKDQDKISFAVDVLKIAQDYVQQYVNDFDDKNDCLCAIDKQIKQLTHQHEDKGE